MWQDKISLQNSRLGINNFNKDEYLLLSENILDESVQNNSNKESKKEDFKDNDEFIYI